MRNLILASLLGAMLFVPSLVQAAILEWDRNTESDMHHYNIYKCLVKGCVVQKTAAMKSAIEVPQPALGVRPTAGQTIAEGNLAVTAVDLAGNESGLSASVTYPPFVPDTTAPGAPTGITVK